MSAILLAIQIRPPGGRLFGPAMWVTWPLHAEEAAPGYRDLSRPELPVEGTAAWIRPGDEAAALEQAYRLMAEPRGDTARIFLSLPSNQIDETVAARIERLARAYPAQLRLGLTLLRQDAALLAGYGQAVIQGYGLDFVSWCAEPAVRAGLDYPLLFERLERLFAPANDIVQSSRDALTLRRSLRGLLLPELSAVGAEAIDRQAPRFIDPSGLSFLARLMAGGLAGRGQTSRRTLQSVTAFLREAQSVPIEELRIALPARLQESFGKDNERLAALCGAKLDLPEPTLGEAAGAEPADDRNNAIFLGYLQRLGDEILLRDETLERLRGEGDRRLQS